MHLKVIGEKSILREKYFEVLEQDIELNGKKKTYHLVKRDPVIVVFPIDDKGNIFLIDQFRSLFNKRILEAVAGHIDKGESILDSAKRELMEETGISGEEWIELGKLENSASIIKSVSSLFVVKKLNFNKQELEEGEDIRVVKMNLKEAIEKIFSKEIMTTNTVVGILLIEKLIKEGKI